MSEVSIGIVGAAGRMGQMLVKQIGETPGAKLVAASEADIGITTVSDRAAGDIVSVPAYRLARCVIAPRGHPLAREKNLTLKKIAAFPLVAYSEPYSGRRLVDEAFARAGLKPRIVCSAIDADVSKTYVEMGLGIAILATVAVDPAHDINLRARDASHLFESSTTYVSLRRNAYLRRYAGDFIHLLAPELCVGRLRKFLAEQWAAG